MFGPIHLTGLDILTRTYSPELFQLGSKNSLWIRMVLPVERAWASQRRQLDRVTTPKTSDSRISNERKLFVATTMEVNSKGGGVCPQVRICRHLIIQHQIRPSLIAANIARLLQQD